MQHITDEQIERFLKGLCTKEEAEKIWAYLKAHPENGYLLNEFGQTDEETPLPEGFREQMLDVIMKKTEDGRANVVKMGAVWKWAAACVVVAGGIWMAAKWAHQPGGHPQLAQQKEAAFSWITRDNKGTARLSMSLPDGSTVILNAGSYIQYRSDFGRYATRDVNVNGEAFFIVARNRQMPFIVHSEGIATTALGTSFEVLADSSQDKVCVQLFTGKVQVSMTGKVNASARQAYILDPGQELIYSKQSRLVSVASFNIKRNGHITLPEIRQAGLENWFMFNNQDLGAVFDQLSAIYNVNIQYPERAVSSMYLIGKLDKRDSLEEVLDDIALLNHLSVTRGKNGYIITRLPR